MPNIRWHFTLIAPRTRTSLPPNSSFNRPLTRSTMNARQHVDQPQLRDVLRGFVSLPGHFESSIGCKSHGRFALRGASPLVRVLVGRAPFFSLAAANPRRKSSPHLPTQGNL